MEIMNIYSIYNHTINQSLNGINRSNSNYSTPNINRFAITISKVPFQANLRKIPTRLEKFEGCILGGAIGDALGAPVEFMRLSEIYKKFGSKGITLKSFIKSKIPLEFTDDTQMTFFTADGLIKSSIKNKSKYSIDFMDVYESYRDWLNTQKGINIFDRGWIGKIKNLYQVKAPGNTCISSLMENIPGTVSNKLNNSKGNGGVMRTAPIGLLYYSKPYIAFKTGIACASLTHSNPDAYLSAGAFASIISHIIQGKTLEDAIKKTIRLLKKCDKSEDVISKLEQSLKLAKSNVDTNYAIKTIGNGNIGSEALSLSLYSALKNKMNFSKSIEMSSNIDGDSDTVAAITGNIVGAYNGISCISKKVLEKLTNYDELKLLSKDLYVQHNNIANKSNRYPTFPTFREVYNIDKMLKNFIKNDNVDKQYKIFLNKKYKELNPQTIRDYSNFLDVKDVPKNIVEKIIIPVELIDKELKNKKAFKKFIIILADNYETLIKNENRRMCFLDEKYTIEDILWTLYEKTLDKNKNIDEIYQRVSYMISSQKYNIKSIIDSMNKL